MNAWWLSKADRVLAVERVRVNQQGIGNKHFKWYQFKEALLDPISWAFVLLALAGDIPNGGLSNFFSLLIVSFGYTAEQSLLYGCISGALQVVTVLGWAYAIRFYGNRVLCSIFFLVIALLGSILLVALPLRDTKGRLAGFYLSQFFVVSIMTVISLITTNVAGYVRIPSLYIQKSLIVCLSDIPRKRQLRVCFSCHTALETSLVSFLIAWQYQSIND